MEGSLEPIKLIEELTECSIKGVVGVWGSESDGSLKAVCVGGVQINTLVQ